MSGDERAEIAAYAAGALIDAVAADDADTIADILSTPDLDWPALAVVLADLAGRGPSDRFVTNVLADLNGTGDVQVVAARYGLTAAAVRSLRDGEEQRHYGPNELGAGRWVRHGLIRVWVADETREEAAA